MKPESRPEPPVELLDGMRHPVPVREDSRSDERRRAAVAGIERAIQRVGVARSGTAPWRRALIAGLAAAALASSAIAAVVVVSRGHGAAPPPVALRDTSAPPAAPVAPELTLRATSGMVMVGAGDLAVSVPAGQTARVGVSDTLMTSAGARARLSMPRGVRVELAPSTTAWVTLATAELGRVRLDSGKVVVSVPRPGGPGTFVVDTPDTEVVVHGTQFAVDVRKSQTTGSIHTAVSVTRGAVLVRHAGAERLLSPGESWSSEASGGEGAASAVVAAPSEGQPRPLSRHTVVLPQKESLAEQNRLFQSSLDARRAGDDARVVASLDELLSRFPDTALAQEARLARFRALERVGRSSDAAREARRYLTNHPDAPARDEARRLVLESTTGEGK